MDIINNSKKSENNNSRPSEIAILTMSIDQLTKINEKIYRRSSLLYSFLNGVFVAMGSTIGLAIVLSIVIYVLKLLGIFDMLSPILNQAKDLKDIYK
jgi:hypothetical protein